MNGEGTGRFDYSVRQLELVRARMPMKLGTKTVRAKKVAIIKSYIRVSPCAHTRVLRDAQVKG